MAIEAVIFDMDGVVIDSESIWWEVDNEFVKSYGVEEGLSKEVKIKAMGMGSIAGTTVVMNSYGIKGDVAKLNKQREKIAEKLYKENLQIKPGIDKFLFKLRKEGYKIGLGTSASRKFLKVIKNKVDFDNWFDAVVTIDDVENTKPAPDIYLKVADILKVDPKNSLVFEDSVAGVKAAKAAGMRCIGVADKRWINGELDDFADKVIYGFDDIINKDIEILA